MVGEDNYGIVNINEEAPNNKNNYSSLVTPQDATTTNKEVRNRATTTNKEVRNGATKIGEGLTLEQRKQNQIRLDKIAAQVEKDQQLQMLRLRAQSNNKATREKAEKELFSLPVTQGVAARQILKDEEGKDIKDAKGNDIYTGIPPSRPDADYAKNYIATLGDVDRNSNKAVFVYDKNYNDVKKIGEVDRQQLLMINTEKIEEVNRRQLFNAEFDDYFTMKNDPLKQQELTAKYKYADEVHIPEMHKVYDTAGNETGKTSYKYEHGRAMLHMENQQGNTIKNTIEIEADKYILNMTHNPKFADELLKKSTAGLNQNEDKLLKKSTPVFNKNENDYHKEFMRETFSTAFKKNPQLVSSFITNKLIKRDGELKELGVKILADLEADVASQKITNILEHNHDLKKVQATSNNLQKTKPKNSLTKLKNKLTKTYIFNKVKKLLRLNNQRNNDILSSSATPMTNKSKKEKLSKPHSR